VAGPRLRSTKPPAAGVVGERWTLLIMRDAFFGVRRFGDFAAHLDGACATCGNAVPPSDLPMLPGPGYDEPGDDFVSKTLTTAHRLLEPIRGH
jgi:HxlR-like helix-turn-helix